MRVTILNPEVAERSCEDCKKYLYHDKGTNGFGVRVERGGKPVLRPKGVPTPCRFCPKIPPDTEPVPENACELNAKNFAAYMHYLECKATGVFPHDAIVQRNAALIRSVENIVDRLERQRWGLSVLNNLKGG